MLCVLFNTLCLFVCLCGAPEAGVLQPIGLLYIPHVCSMFPLSPPGCSTSQRRWISYQRNVELVGREMSGNLAESSEFHATLGIFYMSQIYDMGQTALLPLRRKSCWGFFSPWKIRRLRPGLNPRTWVLKASTQLLDHRSRLTPFVNIGSHTGERRGAYVVPVRKPERKGPLERRGRGWEDSIKKNLK
jgi:hypothetical protein